MSRAFAFSPLDVEMVALPFPRIGPSASLVEGTGAGGMTSSRRDGDAASGVGEASGFFSAGGGAFGAGGSGGRTRSKKVRRGWSFAGRGGVPFSGWE